MEEEPYLLELVRYIHLNPFRAGLVEDPKQLECYRWSGHSALLGKIDRPWQDCRYILSQWGKSLRKARSAYRRFVIEGMSQGRRRELMGGGLIRSMGGWARVEELRRGRESWAYDERVLGGTDFVEAVLKEVGRRDERRIAQKVGAGVLSALAEKIGLRLGLSRAELMGGSRRRCVVEGRNLVSYVAIRGYGTSLTQVAKVLNISVQSVLRGVDRGEEEFQKRGWTVADFIQ